MFEAITDEILRVAVEHYGLVNAPSLTKVSEARHAYSEVAVFRLGSGADQRFLYVKRPLADNLDDMYSEKRIQREYEILSRLWKSLESHPRFSVARPVGLIPEIHVLITEKCPGENLQSLIGHKAKRFVPRRWIGILERYCRLAGEWLKQFHGSTRSQPSPFKADELVQYVEPRLEILVRHSRSGVKREFGESIIRYVRAQASAVSKSQLGIAGRHNDYAPHNIIVEGERLSVIDFTMFDYDSPYYDICNFWHKLESMKLGLWFDGRTISRLQRAFLDGYGEPVDVTSPIFKLVQIRYKVAKMTELLGLRSALPHRRFMNVRMYRSYLDWLLGECAA